MDSPETPEPLGHPFQAIARAISLLRAPLANQLHTDQAQELDACIVEIRTFAEQFDKLIAQEHVELTYSGDASDMLRPASDLESLGILIPATDLTRSCPYYAATFDDLPASVDAARFNEIGIFEDRDGLRYTFWLKDLNGDREGEITSEPSPVAQNPENSAAGAEIVEKGPEVAADPAPAPDAPESGPGDVEPDWTGFSDDPNEWTDAQGLAFDAWFEVHAEFVPEDEDGPAEFVRKGAGGLPDHAGVRAELASRAAAMASDMRGGPAEDEPIQPDFSEFDDNPDVWTEEQDRIFAIWYDETAEDETPESRGVDHAGVQAAFDFMRGIEKESGETASAGAVWATRDRPTR